MFVFFIKHIFFPVAEQPRGDYYGALVGVSVFAAIAVVALVILLMIMVRRQHSVTANITSRGKSEAAFDNPSFKVSNINTGQEYN